MQRLTRFGSSLVLVLSCFLMVSSFGPVGELQAQSPADLLKEANNLLRTAERSMHSGKYEQARQELEKVGHLLESAPADDSPQMKTIRSKFSKLNTDIERRLGPATAATPATTQPVATATAAPAAKMSATTQRQFRELQREMEKTRQSLAYAKWWDLAPSMREGRLTSAGQAVGEYRAQLDTLKAELGPSLAQAADVTDSDALLAAIVTLHEQRAGEPEPVADQDTAVTEALALEKQLLDLHAAYNDRFQGVYGSTMVHGSLLEEQLQQGRDGAALLADLERDIVPAIQPVLLQIVEKYGDNPMDIDNALYDLGLKNEHFFGSRFRDLYAGLNNIQKTRTATAQDMAARAEDTIRGIDGYAEEIRLKKLDEVTEMLLIGQAFDPADQKVNRLLTEVDSLQAAMSARIEADVDARTWAGDIGNFAGPAKPAELTKAALDYFQQQPSWNPDGKGVEILAVAVRGQWDVAARDIFGRVIQWRLPIHLAITNTELKGNQLARVYELSILTQQGPPNNTDKQPPFADYWVGNSWNMRLAKVPK